MTAFSPNFISGDLLSKLLPRDEVQLVPPIRAKASFRLSSRRSSFSNAFIIASILRSSRVWTKTMQEMLIFTYNYTRIPVKYNNTYITLQYKVNKNIMLHHHYYITIYIIEMYIIIKK